MTQARAWLMGLSFFTLNAARAENWFKKPVLNTRGEYADQVTATVKWDDTCVARPLTRKWSEWSALLRASGGLATLAQFPRDVRVEQLSQFWKAGPDFHQFSMFWNEDTPPTYRLAHYVAPNSDMKTEVHSLPLAGNFDSETSLTRIQQAMESAMKAGATPGSRLALVSVTTQENGVTTNHHAQFSNGAALQYWNDGVLCKLSPGRKEAQCLCGHDISEEP